MFKRIMKIVAMSLAIFVGALGVGVGIFAISGGFKNEKIDIMKLYISNEGNDTTLNKQQIYTLDDVPMKIECEPKDATNKTLEIMVSDPLVPNDQEYTGGILKDVPRTVQAGEEFTLKLNKDENNNNIGGVVILKVRPEGDSSFTDVTLTLVVDTPVPDNSLYFSNNINDSYSTQGKSVVMAQSDKVQNIYLKSNLVNAFNLNVTDKQDVTTNLKNVSFNYFYYDVNGNPLFEKIVTDARIDSVYDSVKKLYNTYYVVPLELKTSGYVDVYAKMHKTHEMETDYIAGDFDNMIIPTNNSSTELKIQAQNKLDAYNAFLNKYKNFIDSSDESYEFFKKNLEIVSGETEPRIKLDYSKINESKKFVFQTTSFRIHVTTVNLKNITSTTDSLSYKVLSEKRFTIDELKNEFSLGVTLVDPNGREVTNVSSAEIKTAFDQLKVTPYVYLEKSEYLSNSDLWETYSSILGVVDFKNNKPITVDLNFSSVDGFDGKGVLVKLEKSDNSYKDYITITDSNDSANPYWDFSFNIPMINEEISYNSLKKGLFLQFEVTLPDLNDISKNIVANTYSRVFIEYTDYIYKNDATKLAFTDKFSKMAINTDLENTGSQYSQKAYEQAIDVKLNEQLVNYDSVEYKRVMYFVEESSNVEENYSKVLTMGKYVFKTMQGSEVKATLSDENGIQQEVQLKGERLLYTGTFDNPKYFIHAINASPEPIKVFAVVYLSDKAGNPIDLNGRPIVIDEENASDPIEIVAFAVTDITNDENIYIDSYVNNMNYYTFTKISKEIKQTKTEEGEEKIATYSVTEGDLIKRNHINQYVDSSTGVVFDTANIELLNKFLQVKMLEEFKFDFFASNMELSGSGESIESIAVAGDLEIDGIYVPVFPVKDFYGKVSITTAYNVNTLRNKQLAFNKFCDEIIDAEEFELEGFDNPEKEVIRDDGGNAIYIYFKLMASTKSGDSIRLIATEGVNALKDSDKVNWQVNSIIVNDVTLNDVESYYKLYVRSCGGTSNGYSTNFEFILDDESKSLYEMSLQQFTEGESGNGRYEINYTAHTNLYNVNANAGEELNSDLIDPSQFLYEGGNPSESDDFYVYANIKDYIDHHIKNSDVTYFTNDDAIILVDDLVFKNRNGDNYIYVANKKFEFDEYATSNATIQIDGNEYNIVIEGSGDKKEATLTLPAGSYFPIVNNTDKRTAIVLGEELKIDYLNQEYRIYNSEINDTFRSSARVEYNFSLINGGKKYSSHDYIYDGTKDNTDTKSAIVKNTAEGTAKVNFIKGGKIGAGDTGVKAFLMITFKVNGAENFITKVITYELVQDSIDLVAYNADNEVNTNTKMMKFNAGEVNSLQIASNNPNSVNLLSGNDRVNLFSHVTYQISSQNNIKFVVQKDVGNYSIGDKLATIDNIDAYNACCPSNILKLDIPSAYTQNPFNITLKYKWIDENNEVVDREFVIYCVADPDFEFSVNAENQGDMIIDDQDYYILNLAHNASYELNETIIDRFIKTTGATVKLQVVEGKNCTSTTLDAENYINSALVLKKSYGIYNGADDISIDSIVLKMYLTKGDKTIEIRKLFKINIIPDYVIDTTELAKSTEKNPYSILNGECLYSYSYVNLYEYKNVEEKGALVTDLSEYYDVFTVRKGDGSECVNGVMLFDSSLNSLVKVANLKLEYLGRTIAFALNVHGYNVEFYPNGESDKTTGINEYSINTYYNSNVNVSDYLRVSAMGKDNFIATSSDAINVNKLQIVAYDGTHILPVLENVKNDGSYKYWVAIFDGSSYQLITELNTINIKVINLYVSTGGNFDSTTGSWDYLNVNGDSARFENNDLTINNVKLDSTNINNYFRLYDNEGNSIEIVFKHVDGTVLYELEVPSVSTEYLICYMIAGVVYETEFSLTLTPQGA